MPDGGVLRVVVVRRGKVRPTEFRLRQGETGLSLFRSSDSISAETIIAAVQAAGKQGELGVAEIPVSAIRRLGLRLVRTPGGTLDALVNSLHVEARPTWFRRQLLWCRRVPIPEWFNERIAPELAAAAMHVE